MNHLSVFDWKFDCCTGVMHFEDDYHKNGQEVLTSWKVLSPNAIQVRNAVHVTAHCYTFHPFVLILMLITREN